MKNRIGKIFKKLHTRSPLWLRNFYTPIIYFFRNLKTFRLKGYLWEGCEKETGIALKIAYFGRDKKVRNYWSEMLYSKSPQTRGHSELFVWRLRSFIKSRDTNFDLMLVETSKLTRRFVKFKNEYILPRWFDTLLDVENALDAIQRNDTLKKIKQYNFYCKQTTTEEDLLFFYNKMFKPFITSRHKDKAVMVDYNYFKKRIHKKDSRLFFLMMDNKPVAASFNERKDGMIKFSGIGILEGNREIIKMGVVRALYYFMLNFYKDSGINVINFGGTSPLLSDGLTQFKVALRAFPNTKKLLGEKSISIVPLSDSIATRAVLLANPFININNKKVFRDLFIDASKLDNKKYLLRLLKKTRFRKLDGTRINYWNNPEKILQWIKEENINDMKINEFILYDSLNRS